MGRPKLRVTYLPVAKGVQLLEVGHVVKVRDELEHPITMKVIRNQSTTIQKAQLTAFATQPCHSLSLSLPVPFCIRIKAS